MIQYLSFPLKLVVISWIFLTETSEYFLESFDIASIYQILPKRK